jgi:hypothetical protein
VKKLRIECPLDQQYADLYEAALSIADAYLVSMNRAIEANEANGGRQLRTHLVISVRIRSHASWTAMWCKKVTVRDTEISRSLKGVRKTKPSVAPVPGESLTIELPKGDKAAYPAKTFRSLPTEVRDIARHHELLLAAIRKAALENRQFKKSTHYMVRRTNLVIDDTYEALALADELDQGYQLYQREYLEWLSSDDSS